ncbi:undecaprenyl-phosphate glucose phosphotransferase [Pedobacter frigiditerrae]|uniref:undecaprenyl-phosphate glucose phosphotransferase n=1 Tax=Pedobacter frigiditerrae TaxID=2530452 RepID=UPI0029314CDE|nr:undecaprenyl-phosphate glucose phosphotransferase [Pedobacter frigiditerrae]
MAHQNRYSFLLRYILPLVDLIMINGVYWVADYLTTMLGKNIVLTEKNFNHVIVCNLIWLVCTAYFGLYSILGERKIERVFRSTYKSVAVHFILFTFYLAFHMPNHLSWTFVGIFYMLVTLGFIVNRFLGTSFHYTVLAKFNVAKKVAFIGAHETSQKLITYFESEPNLSYYGTLGGDEFIYDHNNHATATLVLQKLTTAAAAGVKDIYVAVDPNKMSEVQNLIQEADTQGIRIKFVPDLGLHLSPNYGISYLGNEFPIITLRHEPLEEMGNRFKKRAFDVLFSSFVIVFILSWLYPIIAILIKLESRGPVLFKQKRSGRKDEPFFCYKFRSMRVNAESHEKQAVKQDKRITKIGAFLRRTSLDEMPQFFNVFLGSMSVVGPRPHMLAHTKKYKAIIDKFMVRHFVKPGITGWAQVNGLRGETKEDKAMESRVKYDIYYLENWTAMLDVKIVFMTIINVLKGEDNAY